MGNYAKAAVAAHELITKSAFTPIDAWNEAISQVTSSQSARRKGCPRKTFLVLAENGFLKGIPADTSVNHRGILCERAIAAANLVLSNPDADRHYLSENLNYADKQGAYDIVLELSRYGILQSAN